MLSLCLEMHEIHLKEENKLVLIARDADSILE